MATVLVTGAYFGKFADVGIQLLEKAGHIVLCPFAGRTPTKEEVLEQCPIADAIICDLEQIDRDVLEASPRLKIVARRGVGVDNIDTAYAAEKGILVVTTLGVVETPVAELVMLYILEFSRKLHKHNLEMHKGIWNRQEAHGLQGKTLGIVGMGRIAYKVAQCASAFGMRVTYSDPKANEQAEQQLGAVRLPLEELLTQADFVTLHLPLQPQTRGFFDQKKLEMLKPEAFLINTARGAVVDNEALCKALREGRLAGAAVDVFDGEPNTESPLRGMPNVWLTPHIATYTQETFNQMDVIAAQNIIYFWG